MNKTIALALGLITVNAASYDYRSNGANWGSISPECLSEVPNQSPIDLVSPKEVIKNKAYPIVSSEEDRLLKDYNNVRDV